MSEENKGSRLIGGGGGQLPLSLQHRPAFDRGEYHVSACNEAATAWIDSWPSWPDSTWGLNVHGPEASGKSHLAEVWARKSGAVMLRPADLAVEKLPEFLRQSRYAVLDNVDETLPGVPAFHLYNMIVEQRGALLVLSRTPVSRMELHPADVKSRFAALPAVAISDPDDALISGIMDKLFRDRQLFVAEEVLAFLVGRMERSFSEARALVETIDAMSLAEGRRITLPLARRALDVRTKGQRRNHKRKNQTNGALSMDLGIKGKKALVCASSKGLGKASAMALAQNGADLTICSRTPEAIEATAEEIRSATGATVHAVACDITTDEGRAKALAPFDSKLDILVNNAGGPPPGNFRDWTRDDWIKAVDANMLTAIELIKATIDGMIERKWGRIVNITSGAVKSPIAILGLSNGARAGLTGFCAGIAREVVKDGVTINGLLPGPFDTDRLRGNMKLHAEKAGVDFETYYAEQAAAHTAGRFGTPDEFGQTCAFLCSDHAGFINGQNLLMDGGAFRSTMQFGVRHFRAETARYCHRTET